MATPVVLTFNMQPEKLGKLRMVCAMQKIRLRPVEPDEHGMTLGHLAGLTTSTPAIAAPVEDEMMVICGLGSAQLDALLMGMRRFGVGSVPLKAVLTETNSAWRPAQLVGELKAERDAIARGIQEHK